jgi:hypothetical protein
MAAVSGLVDITGRTIPATQRSAILIDIERQGHVNAISTLILSRAGSGRGPGIESYTTTKEGFLFVT